MQLLWRQQMIPETEQKEKKPFSTVYILAGDNKKMPRRKTDSSY